MQNGALGILGNVSVSMGLVNNVALNDCNLVLSKERKTPKSDH